ncbi:hypothetical protein, partial [Sulfurimonas sp.]|uniref:hypothetical protein n=1 Tax=Sulfurimonas sp. TaxID=2022749 RepID=UPI003D12238D
VLRFFGLWLHWLISSWFDLAQPTWPVKTAQFSVRTRFSFVFLFFKKKNWHTFVWDWDMNRNH